MLVVDPLKRITIQEIRKHKWFAEQIPLYLAKAPHIISPAIDKTSFDPEIIREIAQVFQIC